MTSPNDTTTEHRGLASRAELARQTLRLRAALHEAEEAERAEAAADPATARAQLVARLEHLVGQRREQLDAELEAVRAEVAASLSAARREAAEMIGRAEARLQDAERAHAEREAMAHEAAAREAGTPPVVLPVDDTVARPWAPEHDIWAPTARASAPPPPPPAADIAPPAGPAPTTAPAPLPARVTPGEPIKVEIDAESFARVFGTMIAALIRDQGMRHHEPVAPPPKASFWSNAKHLDVLLIGVTMVIALLILAAWLV